jgi:hypothetical protein
MKSYKLLVVSVLALGLQTNAAFAESVFPADAEASYNLPALSTSGDETWGVSQRQAYVPFPSDGGNTDD